jgi:hypothetical protein
MLNEWIEKDFTHFLVEDDNNEVGKSEGPCNKNAGLYTSQLATV